MSLSEEIELLRKYVDALLRAFPNDGDRLRLINAFHDVISGFIAREWLTSSGKKAATKKAKKKCPIIPKT